MARRVKSEHTHKYIKVSGKFTHVWKCADMDCKHFVYGSQSYIIVGRASICWGCGDKFPLDEDAMQEDMPRCNGCRNPDMNSDFDLDAFIEQQRNKPA